MGKRTPRNVICYAEGNGGRWEGFCWTYDLAVQGKSFDEVYRKLNEQIALYHESVAALPKADRRRLLNRSAPLSVVAKGICKIMMARFRSRDTKERHEYSLPVNCAVHA